MSAATRPLPTISIAATASGDEAWLQVAGAVDLTTATKLSDALRAAEREQPRVIGLELSAIDFLDSSGIHLIVAADQRARMAGRRFVIANPSRAVARVLEVTGLDRRIELAPSSKLDPS
jgi:anti-anti-sigma factor